MRLKEICVYRIAKDCQPVIHDGPLKNGQPSYGACRPCADEWLRETGLGPIEEERKTA